MYHITRDGFIFLVMGFTRKEAYIRAFNYQKSLISLESPILGTPISYNSVHLLTFPYNSFNLNPLLSQ